jgi:hypothetical protein
MWCDYFKNGNIYGVDINLNEYHSFKNELSTKYCAFQDNNVKNNELKEKQMLKKRLDSVYKSSRENNTK